MLSMYESICARIKALESNLHGKMGDCDRPILWLFGSNGVIREMESAELCIL